MAELEQQLKDEMCNEEPTINAEDPKEFTNSDLSRVSLEKDNASPIISEELLLTSTMDGSTEKVDELSSLEREIAEMDKQHVEPTAPGVALLVSQSRAEGNSNGGDEADKHHDKILFEMQPPSRKAATSNREDSLGNGKIAANTAHMEDILAHEDLIAVLKGIDHDDSEEAIAEPHEREQQHAKEESIEGVTIEGEGEFQVIDVFDDESDEINSKEGDAMAVGNEHQAKKSSNSNSKPNANIIPKLTREEERAVAMEQMEGLKLAVEERQRRRKQDIKPMPVEVQDLVNSLGAEWSDDDAAIEGVRSGLGAKSVRSASFVTNTNITVSSSMPKTNQSTAVEASTNPTKTNTQIADEKGLSGLPTVTNVVVLKPPGKTTAINNRNTTDAPDGSNVSSTGISGFKRTRIIKRKIIWDPDAPETQFSYAKLVRGNSKTMSEPVTEKTSSSTKTNSTIKKEPQAKKARPATPKGQKTIVSAVFDVDGTKMVRAVTPSKVQGKVSTATTSTSNTEESTGGTYSAKRRSQTPVANGAGGSSGAKKKKVSELDRLMGDEGAVNMLNSLESERVKLDSDEQGDKPHKPLMRSRAVTISERVTKRDIPPTVAKKESPNSNSTATTISSSSRSTTPTTKIKRGAKPKASSTWDFVYKQKASEDSMIIRRRSNSSYSSTASLHRLSLDGPTPPKAMKTASTSSTPASASISSAPKSISKSAGKTVKSSQMSVVDDVPNNSNSTKQSAPFSGGKIFEFAKPESKSQQKGTRRNKSPSQTASNNPLTSDMKKAASPGKRPSRSPANLEEKEKSAKSSATISKAEVKEDTPSSASSVSDVIVKKAAKVAQIIFNTHKAKMGFTFTVQMMNKLVDILDKLAVDSDCNVVVVITNSPNFCQGIDFTDLTQGTVEKRKNAAVQMATAVKNYLKTLATFPKPIIAGVNGHNIGLGVTQLPLFDIVIASDKASYETPYAKFGQVPEGFCIWNNITKIRNTFKTKLFWLCEKLHSTESALAGLVNKLNAPNKVNEDALCTAKKIAAMSAESYRAMKKTTINNNLNAIVTALDEEFDIIIKQWNSVECYENMRKYLETGHL